MKRLRQINRIDYNLLNSTGEKREKSTPTQKVAAADEASTNDNTMEVVDQLSLEVLVMRDDINDAIDENPISGSIPEEIDAILIRLEDLRTKFRTKHRELEHHAGDDYADEHEECKHEVIAKIKNYIKHAREYKMKMRLAEDVSKHTEVMMKEKSIKFLIEETCRCMSELEINFGKDVKAANDNDLIVWKTELSEHLKTLERVGGRFQEMLKVNITDESLMAEVDKIGQRYAKLTQTKVEFASSLKNQISTRELSKQNMFQEARLNINLAKFSGYDSTSDIYTFQSEFEKLHLRTTPTRLLPELLRNNFLLEPALSLVKGVQDIAEIWSRLKTAYGDTKIMLSRKLQQVNKLESLSKTKDTEKLICGLSRLINVMKDLMYLSKKHNIERNLYYGDAIERIYRQMGDERVTRWLTSICDTKLGEQEVWLQLVAFLEKEMKIQQQKYNFQGQRNEFKEREASDKSNRYKPPSSYYSPTTNENREVICYICGAKDGESDHSSTSGPGGCKVIQYFSCKTFAEKTPAERLSLLRKKGYCIQCLLPGADSTMSKHKEGKCQHDFVCQHASHQRYPSKKHILVCDEHKNINENMEMLEKYKIRCINKNTNLPSFAREIKLSFHVQNHKDMGSTIKDASPIDGVSADVITDRGIYLLQVVKINKQRFTIFYDSGCGDFISTYASIKRLGMNAVQQSAGPILLGGVGDTQTQSKHGIYAVKLPLCNGGIATLSGVCLDKITSTFPSYPLGEAENDIHSAFAEEGGDPTELPKIPAHIGGDVDLMIGVKYLRYHPKMIFQLPSGLAIYESIFKSADGGRGVIGGPHQVFNNIHQHFVSQSEESGFYINQHDLFKTGFQVNPDVSLLGYKDNFKASLIEATNCEHEKCFHASHQKLFNQVEMMGSEIDYRCVNCRQCKTCKNHEEIEAISVREEVEQKLINDSVKINSENFITTANLPFINNPHNKLAPNKGKAMKVYQQQLKKLNKPENKKDKETVIESEAKLQKLGYVEYVMNLTEDQKAALKNHHIQYYIPWRAVWKNSVSTPCRIVFDASQATSSGYSLNDLLAKGRNNMNRLQEILIRWSIHKVAIHSDISKMYNTIKLEEKDWCFQRYIWEENLNPSQIPQEKVIRTLIYGVKSSGNQAEYGLRKVAELSKDEYPLVNTIVQKDMYVDDCLTGEHNKEAALTVADQLEMVLNRGGFRLKGISFSGEDPPDTLSDDGITISVAGMTWYTKEDVLSLNVGELNFSKKHRGKKPVTAVNIIPEKLTRRHCVSKVAEIYDLTGKITPITASMKLDLHELVIRKLDWDDVVPAELRSIWNTNFEMMQEINTLKFQRAVIPDDAVSLDIDTIDIADASKDLACVAVYVRFKRSNGEYSCQLVLARSRLIPDKMTQPRAELYAALLNAHTGEVVRKSFYNWHKSAIKLTDSQIVLHWISNDNKPLKQWTRNRVIEINRFTKPDQWFYVKTTDMIADLGTRRGATLKDVNQNSDWINGFPWMKFDVSNFPMKSVNEIKLNESEVTEMQKETPYVKTDASSQVYLNDVIQRKIPKEVAERYKFSKYLVDPNLHRFKNVVKIMGYVLKFCKLLLKKNVNTTKSRHQSKSTNLTEEEIADAENYFFKKCSLEIKNFLPAKRYQNITSEKDGILMYTGRILSIDDVSVVGRYTEAMKDLTASTFVVPVVDKHSPVAYSIVNDVHWHDKVVQHGGIETVHRQVLKKAFIIEGRSIIKAVKKSCERCRYLAKRTIDVIMGPVSTYNLTIAPAFYVTQMDLCGPFKAYSPINKRTTVKIWLIVFCCATTSATRILVMDDYSSTSFIQAFTRFACYVGFPKILLCDEGSQLIKGCTTMRLNFKDLRHKLHQNAAVQFELCPVGGHNMNGKVERKIREINSSLEKTIINERLSLLQWETIAAEISNCINDLPLALGSITADFESMDLITPNRLCLGRNNDRSPTGNMVISNNPCRILKENNKIFISWFENWLQSHVPKLMEQQKWFEGDTLKIGDVVLFLKQESSLSHVYQYGIVEAVEHSKDGIIRKAEIKYRNHNENVFRKTYRSTRSLVLIHHVDETNLVKELGEIACIVDTQLRMDIESK